MRRRPLDRIEAEIRATRGRLAALLVEADRHYGLRASLHGLLRFAAKPDATADATLGRLRQLALPTALAAFVAGLIGARHAGPSAGKADHGDKV